MPRLVDMGDLIERAALVADKVGDDHISDAAWRLFAHMVYNADVYTTVEAAGLRYFEYTATLTTTGAAYVSEPSDHAKTLRLDYVASATDRRQLHQLMPGEEARLATLTGTEPVYYALIDDRIYLYPTPSSGLTLEMRYVPQPPDLTTFADDDCVDVVSADGEACVIWGMAALAKARASQDAALHLAKQGQHKLALEYWAANRSVTQAQRRTVTDIDPLFDLPRDPGDYT
jgi:hypothetical protein